jgi:hypothetical protein
VTRQGGHIWVTRNVQKGSTFSFALPAFSLTSVIAPLLKNDKWPAESVAVVMVDVPFPAAGDSREEWSQEARSLLQRSLLPDLDVLLPTTNLNVEGERFFVAAFADGKGAPAVASRIREQFERHSHWRQASWTPSVSYKMLQPISRDVGISPDNIVASMAAHIEASIESQVMSEALYYE